MNPSSSDPLGTTVVDGGVNGSLFPDLQRAQS